MKDNTIPLSTTRRGFLKRSAAGAAALGASSFAVHPATADAAQFSSAHIHEQAAAAAKKLAAGRSVTLKILEPSGSLGDIKPVAGPWTKETGIDIQYIEVPLTEINQKVMLEAVSRSGSFDIALPASFGIPDQAAAGVLVDLDHYATKYAPPDYQTGPCGYLYFAANSYKGHLYGYETDGDLYMMFYLKNWLENPDENKKFEDKHGYSLKVPDTWAELDTMMAFFNRPEKNMYGGALFRSQYFIAWEFWGRFHAKGYYPFRANLEPQINNDAGVRALEELIAASKFLYPGAKTNGLFENFEAYGKGGIFCNVGWGGTQKYLNSAKSSIKDNLLFGQLPGGMVDGKLLQTPYFNWGWNYVVNRYSRNQEIAYLFTLYACSPRMSTLAVRDVDGYFDPYRLCHYTDSDIVDNYTESFLKVHKYGMGHCIPDLYLQGHDEYFDSLRINVQAANAGQKSPKRALDDVVKKWNQITDRIGRKGQERQWEYLKSEYAAAIRGRLLG